MSRLVRSRSSNPSPTCCRARSYTATITTGAMNLAGHSAGPELRMDLHHGRGCRGHTANGHFDDSPQRRHWRASQSDRQRYIQHCDEPRDDKRDNLFVDGTGRHHRDRPGCLRRGWKYADVHACGKSCGEHSVHSHNHHRRSESRRHRSGRQLCVDVYHRSGCGGNRARDRFDDAGQCCHRRGFESGR